MWKSSGYFFLKYCPVEPQAWIVTSFRQDANFFSWGNFASGMMRQNSKALLTIVQNLKNQKSFWSLLKIYQKVLKFESPTGYWFIRKYWYELTAGILWTSSLVNQHLSAVVWKIDTFKEERWFMLVPGSKIFEAEK